MSTQRHTVAPAMNYDGRLTVAVGRSRTETKWKNKEMLWSELAARLSETTRTGETVEEYKALPKTEQQRVKDVGGFVGGPLKGGRRKSDSVISRQLLTLDADYAYEGLWDAAMIVLDSPAAILYSTHKHTPAAPRVRLVLPLSRPVSPDEYQAIARRIAADIDIEAFDDTTYEPHRLMYWPSTPADGDYAFEVSDGAPIDADAILARYDDWQDQTTWPESSRVHKAIKRAAEKQEDPTEKKGIIGVFCRAYDVSGAMEKFLPGVYTQCDTFDRYTYNAGTSAAGAVVYEDGKFLYSHHSTDPCCGRLVNAFDLVRIHKFGDRDEDTPEGTPANRLPSFQAMQELAAADDEVRIQLGEETLAEARQDFTETDKNWLTKLDVNGKGQYLSSARNVKLILENDPGLVGAVAMDDFAHRITVLRSLPWRKLSRGSVWADSDDSGLRNYLEEVYNIKGKGMIEDALSEVTTRHAFNPLRDYIEGLTWDGIPRIDTVFIDYLGAEDTSLNRTMTRKSLVGAVARILRPGIKFDNVLTLIGRQGQGKSYILSRLARGWYSESLTTVQGKEAMEHIQGFWIIELAELAAIRKADFEATKQFISKQEDAFRAAYGRRTERHPRQCVFFATTNVSDFIRDPSGGRRWWPMTVDKEKRRMSPFDDLTDDVIDQIWAEAADAFRGGEPLHLSEADEAEAQMLQAAHTDESPLTGPIREYLDLLLPANWEELDIGERRDYIHGGGLDMPKGTVQRNRVCALEVWVELLKGDPKMLTRLQSIEINDVLRRTEGWSRPPSSIWFKIYGKQKGFIRDESRNFPCLAHSSAPR